jgi:hypothetical protein
MAVRVDFDGIRDAVASSSAGGGGVPVSEDGERMFPWQPRPFTTKAEYHASNAMRLMSVPAEEIRQIRPPMINEAFPPTQGYHDTPLTVDEVLDTERWSPQLRSWVSGSARLRHADAQADMWSGTPRNIGAGQGVM